VIIPGVTAKRRAASGRSCHLARSSAHEKGALHVSIGNERLLAGLIAAVITWRTRSVLFTLGGGMATLWTLQAIGQSL
jgi:hypothetical protein